ncbi:hypothetical protein [Halalkalibacterium ligniniphilum]|uniref:hypothetical protein n=1 Tax=Halalkalibacterium ligniniphilum TaxID=1134413 RepID=UPI000348E346|nr:hypothetical protein [Halalkalibacterium ligniniphilum]
MGECKLDHSLTDVQQKLKSQSNFLPAELYQKFETFLKRDLSQEALNKAFHLLKKYDLASEEEQSVRNEKIEELIQTTS